MSDDRELDVRVHRELFGQECQCDFTTRRWGYYAVVTSYLGRREQVFADLPKYTTDVRDAWLVVEEMRRRGYRPLVEGYPGGWVVQFCGPGGCGIESHGGPNVAEVICKAALGWFRKPQAPDAK